MKVLVLISTIFIQLAVSKRDYEMYGIQTLDIDDPLVIKAREKILQALLEEKDINVESFWMSEIIALRGTDKHYGERYAISFIENIVTIEQLITKTCISTVTPKYNTNGSVEFEFIRYGRPRCQFHGMY